MNEREFECFVELMRQRAAADRLARKASAFKRRKRYGQPLLALTNVARRKRTAGRRLSNTAALAYIKSA